jgi:aminoglycoside phosphotransferase (APT) family kinase protein
MARERDYPEAGWVRAKAILSRAIQGRVRRGTTVEVGRIKRVGRGLSRDLFAAEVNVSPDLENLSGVYVVPLPRWDAIPGLDARTRREAALLERLGALKLPFRVPRLIGVVPEAGRPVMVREFLEGLDLDLRAGRHPCVRPWEVVGWLAAAIHSIDVAGFQDILPGHTTRREHAEAALGIFNGLDGGEIQDASAWAWRHLPPKTSSVFVHGDLLGQNILLWPEEPPAVIDWEYAMRGDPAYDQAIVTRGVRRPFQVDRGLERLLEAYGAAGGALRAAADVRFHEICLAARWYREALDGRGAEPPDQALLRLRGILRRAKVA